MNKFFYKIFFPALYGLMNYFTIRLLQDTQSHDKFWQRDWRLNTFEICTSILVGYLGIVMFRKIFEYFDRHWTEKSYKGISREVALLIGANLILVNAIFTPMAAFTDDGLSLSDFVEINLIPTLYALIYYGIKRTRKYFNSFIENRIQIEKLTNEQLTAELKFLKAQYHPHFLFNALNTIYFQMDEDVPAAKKTVERFSDILRYQLYNQHEKLHISQEFDNLKNYIELQLTRTSRKLNLKVHFDEQLGTQAIYPLLLLPLVENAFKFVDGQYNVIIDARLAADGISFAVENSIRTGSLPATNGGIGLENLKRRLNLLYPDRHRFTTDRTDSCFKAFLFIPHE
jgi:two-component system LytT family sensor kinase